MIAERERFLPGAGGGMFLPLGSKKEERIAVDSNAYVGGGCEKGVVCK